jgi:N-acetylglucosamine-6-phosphate deacetylase
VTTPDIIQKLARAGVVVSAGHSNATYGEIVTALRHGLTGFTHLFNAMSQLTGREPGVVGAALDDTASWCGIIVDGEHTNPVVLRIALRCKPHNRFMLVTDAMPGVGTDQTSFSLQGRRITVSGHVCLDESGRLAGSNIDMASCVRNAVSMLGLPLTEAVQMASRNPAAFLGLGHEVGRIAPGYRANLVLATDRLEVVDTWIHGRSSAQDTPV